MSLRLGAIADDFTGATDLAGILVQHGLRTQQVIGVPDSGSEDAMSLAVCDAVVIALKTRTASASDAVAQSLAALDWLQQRAAQQRFSFRTVSMILKPQV